MKKSSARVGAQANMISRPADCALNVFFILWVALCIIPLLLVVGISLSSEMSILTTGYRIIPTEFSAHAYEYLIEKGSMITRALVVSIYSTVCGTITSVIVTTLFAYPLSRKYFKYRNIFSFIVFFTMIFSGGTVANYMVKTQIMGLKDNYLVYIIPNLISAWNVILLRTFITSSVPDDLAEAAKIDGASEWTTFTKIVIPLSKPGIATIALFNAINLWNDWYTPSLYIKNKSMYNLQYLTYSMLADLTFLKNNMGLLGGNMAAIIADMPTEGIRMAVCTVTILPIVVAYPFFQKYFVKGLTIGAVKG